MSLIWYSDGPALAVYNLFSPGDWTADVAKVSLEGKDLVGDIDCKFLLGDPIIFYVFLNPDLGDANTFRAKFTFLFTT